MTERRTLHIVITGCGSTLNRSGLMPDPSDLNNAVEKLKSSGYEPNVMILDSNLIYVVRHLKGELAPESKFVMDDLQLAKQYVDEVNVLDERPYSYEEIPRKSKDHVLYISWEEFLSSSFELMSHIETYVTEHRHYLTSPKSSYLSIVTRLIDVINGKVDEQGEIFESTYPLYEGKKMVNLSLADKKRAIYEMNTGCQIIVEYMEAGFLQKENKKRNVKSWKMNPETCIIKGVCEIYGLKSEVKDQTPILQITKNSTFRQQLLELLCRVVSNFAYNNSYVSRADINWYSPEVYTYLIGALK